MERIKRLVKQALKEMNVTGTGASFTPGTGEQYATPFAFNSNKKAKGTKNMYNKLGFKSVNQKQLRKKSKAFDYKDLWK